MIIPGNDPYQVSQLVALHLGILSATGVDMGLKHERPYPQEAWHNLHGGGGRGRWTAPNNYSSISRSGPGPRPLSSTHARGACGHFSGCRPRSQSKAWAREV